MGNTIVDVVRCQLRGVCAAGVALCWVLVYGP